MSSATVQTLRAVNQNLLAGLARLRGGPDCSAAIAPMELAGLLAEVVRATDCLRRRDVHASADPELEHEISEYRSHLEQLAKVLPSVSGRLLTEKARLQAARAHVTKAAAWAQARAKTL